jgi:hypothetical protein
MIRMVSKIIVGMYKHLNEFKEDTNKQLNEIRQIMQVMKEEFNKILKEYPLKLFQESAEWEMKENG